MGENFEKGTKWWIRFVFVPIVVAVIVGGGLYILFQPNPIPTPTLTSTPPPEDKTPPNREHDQHNSNTTQQPPEKVDLQKPKAKPEELISTIQRQQKENVKESWGEFAYQCFTDKDLDHFVQNKTTERITDSLKIDSEFLDMVIAIRKMEHSEREKLLVSADKPLRPTWAELGRISRKGQTEAGQEAERMIATAIVNLVKELVNMPESEFLSLYDD